MITSTFTTTLDENFLPLQLINGDKTLKNLPMVKFSSLFSLSVNLKYCSNSDEGIRVFNDIIIPYVIAKRVALALATDHPA